LDFAQGAGHVDFRHLLAVGVREVGIVEGLRRPIGESGSFLDEILGEPLSQEQRFGLLRLDGRGPELFVTVPSFAVASAAATPRMGKSMLSGRRSLR
jgi:hypothetical protein